MHLSVEDISLSYGKKVLLEGVNLSAGDGSVIALVGRNGTGKSTFMRAILGLQPLSSGKIEVDGKDVGKMSIAERSSVFSYVSTASIDVAYLTVKDVVAMGRVNSSRWNGGLSIEDEKIVEDSLVSVSALEMSDRYIATLSDGERQRVMIARAISQQTPVVVLDEPTAFLDVPNRVQIHSLLRSLAVQSGKLVLFSTHEMELARKYSDYFWFVDSGTVRSYPVSEFKLPEDFRI